MKNLISRLLTCAALVMALSATAASTMVGLGNGTLTVAVTTSATVTVTLTADNYTIHHTGIQSDASTASASTDTVTIMNSVDSATPPVAVVMVASFAAGRKLNLVSGAAWTIAGADVPKNASGDRVIQLKAAGNGAMVEIKREP